MTQKLELCTMTFIESLKNKIKLYKELIPFGKFNPNPPIEFEALKSFENRYGIVIPDDYKEFILKIGNGEFELNNDYFLELTASTWGDVSKPFNPEIESEIYNGLLEVVELSHAGGMIFLVANGDDYGHIWYRDNNRESDDFSIQPFLDKNQNKLNFGALINLYFDSEMEYYLRAMENAKKTAQQLIVRNDVNEKNKFEEKSFMFKLLRLFTRNN
ncbi:SMI1/KNR4 family protein [Epilithonimonas lactis]|nr:SMI1/KNR4 family protein [Epilithonimonas lactis]SEQ87041.1 SMI1 / KNR4 family (SUKH-1) [Epilithonimonas lactis]